ncbi:MAG: type I restriction-modification system subunit M N-terminal domain-containing protein, partial [Methanomassiliicoccales archaeon]
MGKTKVRNSMKKLNDFNNHQQELQEEHLSRSDIDSILKKAADLIRTRVDYKFILILLFLKRISDKWDVEFEEAYREALSQGLSEADARAEA